MLYFHHFRIACRPVGQRKTISVGKYKGKSKAYLVRAGKWVILHSRGRQVDRLVDVAAGLLGLTVKAVPVKVQQRTLVNVCEDRTKAGFLAVPIFGQ